MVTLSQPSTQPQSKGSNTEDQRQPPSDTLVQSKGLNLKLSSQSSIATSSISLMTSGGSAISGVLTSGIQDIAALLPLLGTEQCEEQIGSVLTKGYLFAAVTPMSIFGSLGLASAGFKAFVAAISIPQWKVDGAQFLLDAGFEPKGKNLGLIMLDKDEGVLLARKELHSMMKELHIEDSSKVTVTSPTETWKWNVGMIISTAISCIISITPYIHLNLRDNQLDHLARWGFPVTRAIGGFLTATMIQFLTQSRLLEIMRKQLILDSVNDATLSDFICQNEMSAWSRSSLDWRCYILLDRLTRLVDKSTTHASPVPPIPPPVTSDRAQAASCSSHGIEDIPRATPIAQHNDLEQGVKPPAEIAFPSPTQHEPTAETRGKWESLQGRIRESHRSIVSSWITLVLLLIGIIASVGGYIGCFSVVQGAESSGEALIWVSLEAGLCVIRMIIWGINPKYDDAPLLKLKVTLDETSLLPTCTSSAEHIERERILPLVHATEFFKTITSCTGLLKQFSDPTVTLYYTLTRRYNTTSKAESDMTSEEPQHVLYITISHGDEKTMRVYVENFDTDRNAITNLYSADALTVNEEQAVLRTKIRYLIRDDDPIAGNPTLREKVRDHYQAILHQVDLRPNDAVCEIDWTLKPDSSTWTFPGGQRASTKKRDLEYLEQGQLERKVRDLFVARGQWIKDCMVWLYCDRDQVPKVQLEGIGINGKERLVVETLLIMERWLMESVHADEVYEWEKKLSIRFLNFINNHDRLQEQLKRTWRASLWERWEEGRVAMEARMDEAKSRFSHVVGDVRREGADHEDLQTRQLNCNIDINQTWKSLLESCNPDAPPRRGTPRQFLEWRLEASKNALSSLSLALDQEEINRRLEKWQKMADRLRREMDGVEERLDRGFEACHEFWSDEELVQLTHSDSSWLFYNYNPSWEKDWGRALKNNKHIIHIEVMGLSLSDTDVTRFFSLARDMPACNSVCWNGRDIPDSVELPPNILFISECQLSEGQKATLDGNITQSNRNQRTTFEFNNMHLSHPGGDLCGFGDCSFTVRFSGPSSGHLKLQLVHWSDGGRLAVELGENSHEEIPLSNTLTLKEITIWNRSQQSLEPGLTFAPNTRNSLVFKGSGYCLRDIKLLDESGLPYKCGNGGENVAYAEGGGSGFFSQDQITEWIRE